MKKRTSLVAAVVVAGMLATGCAENPADKVPSADVKTPAVSASESATPAAMVEGTVYTFAEGTEVGFVGSKVTGSHDGGFKAVKGTVTVPEEGLTGSAIDLTIDTKSIYSDNEKLTKHLKEDDFFAVEKFPEASFKSTKVEAAEDGSYNVTGSLTLHGVTKEISFPATIAVEGEALTTTAEFSINRKDFEIVYAGKPDDLIRDEVVIKYDITANKGA